MIWEGYRDWKSSTITGSTYSLDSGSMTRGMASMAGCPVVCTESTELDFTIAEPMISSEAGSPAFTVSTYSHDSGFMSGGMAFTID